MSNMTFKHFLLFFGLFGFVQLVGADVFFLYPVEQQVANSQSIVLGNVMAGETFEVVVSTRSNYGDNFEWQSVFVPLDSLPEGWSFLGVEKNPTHQVIKIAVPKNEKAGAFNFLINVSNADSEISDESVNATVFVKDDLLKLSVKNLKRIVTVNQPTEFALSISNDSIASHEVFVESDLPKYWFVSESFSIKPQSSKTVFLKVNPRVYGYKNFSFVVKSNLSGIVLRKFDSILQINPTLIEKFSAPHYGFPVFAPSLSPIYVLDSFLAFLAR